MDIRNKTLQEALQRNAEETARWSAFKDEQVQTIDNLHNFQKHLEVEIMVPIGNKALLPGVLYHTNEVMVTHFNGLFSKCTVQKAQEILHSRVEVANERLRGLEDERELFVNRQELPRMQDIFSGETQQEIIEEYDEEKEKEWRKLHRERVREHKQREAEERRTGKVEDEEFDQFMAKLEELEMIEELNGEFDDEVPREATENPLEEPEEPQEPPNPEVIQTKRKSLTFSDKDSVKVIEAHEAPFKAAKQPDSILNLNPDLTLHLEVIHSPTVFNPPAKSDDITSPADIFRVFGQCLESAEQPKSILKNREAVEREIHLPGPAVRETSVKKRSSKEILSVDHSVILGEIKERNPGDDSTSKDSQQVPKRPVSRFKSARETS